VELLQKPKCRTSARVGLSGWEQLTTEELNVSRELTLTATEVEIDFVDAIAVQYAEVAMAWEGVRTTVAEVVELDSKAHGLERCWLKGSTGP